MAEAEIQKQPKNGRNYFFLRGADLILSSFFLLISLPMLIPFVIVKYLFDGLPLFYNSKRIGAYGKLITVYKFRTMINNPGMIANYIGAMGRNGFEVIPLDAPIYTPVGRIFEKIQLVEMPQFWNVLLGNMSLVGYRPLPEKLVAEIAAEFGDDFVSRRHEGMPGVTGISQVMGKNKLSNYDRVRVEVALNHFLATEKKIGKLMFVYGSIILDTVVFVLSRRTLCLGNTLRLMNAPSTGVT